MKRQFNKFNKHQRVKKINPLVTVTSEECGENAEKMIRRFIKKVKRTGIIEEVRDRRYFTKPTALRAQKKRDKKRLIEKVHKRENELINTRDNFRKRGK